MTTNKSSPLHSVFLSVVIVVRNQCDQLRAMLEETSALVATLASDYELIVVDNASTDDSLPLLRELVAPDGLPNLQIYALTKEIDTDTATWVGLENALGDYMAAVDPCLDNVHYLREMLDQAAAGVDVVFAVNKTRVVPGITYRVFRRIFNTLFRHLGGVDLERDAPAFRVLSKRVVNFVLRHPVPSLAYRHLPATSGFVRANLAYSAPRKSRQPKRLGEAFDRGLRMLVSSTQAPMRIVTSLSLFGAISNFLYSIYVIAVAILKADVAPGWVTLSLQQSGMFFLISLVLLVLGEYILHMARLTNEGPMYHIAQEFTSANILGRSKLNVEEVVSATSGNRV